MYPFSLLYINHMNNGQVRAAISAIEFGIGYFGTDFYLQIGFLKIIRQYVRMVEHV
jgi:hypothetical protein